MYFRNEWPSEKVVAFGRITFTPTRPFGIDCSARGVCVCVAATAVTGHRTYIVYTYVCVCGWRSWIFHANRIYTRACARPQNYHTGCPPPPTEHFMYRRYRLEKIARENKLNRRRLRRRRGKGTLASLSWSQCLCRNYFHTICIRI